MSRTVRVQAAIVQNHEILLIKHREHRSGREYWLLPGGGVEADETEEAALLREIREETCLDVAIERLLLDEPNRIGGIYQRHKTFLCRVLAGEVRPGYEPELEVADVYTIADVCWIDLRDSQTWDALILKDRWTFPLLKQIQALLGYAP